MASPIYTTGDPVWNSLEDATRVPLSSELESGWPCGEVDPELLNFVSGHGWNLIHNMLTLSGLTPSIANLHQLAQAVQTGKVKYAVAGGTADALTATLAPVPPALVAGMTIAIKTGASPSTGAMTINVNSLGAVSILRGDGSAMQAGDAQASSILTLVSDGAAFRCVNPVPSLLSVYNRTQVFTSSGTFTVPAGVTSVEVEVWGAGGAGGASGDGSGGSSAGNSGAGGGGGGYGYKRISGLTPGGTVTVTVGAAGAASTSSTSGSGGTSSFGAYVSCTGGAGGSYGIVTAVEGGAGGTSTGADIGVDGATGGYSGNNTSSTPTQSQILVIYNKGGGAAGGLSSTTLGGTGTDGSGIGSGGSGASGGSLLLGGDGAPGLVVVRW